MLSSDVEPMMLGERKHITCMFVDVRGFTALSERLSPNDIFKLLNVYFAEIITIIFSFDGTIDKFIGDSIMVIFGAPMDQTDHALRAAQCAIEIQAKVKEINAQKNLHEAIGMGIGINTGYAIAGCLGSPERSDYTVIGDTVNTAQRIESQSLKGQILVGPATHDKVQDALQCRSLGARKLKGKSEPVEIFEVVFQQ
jgi:adenylate cyclase